MITSSKYIAGATRNERLILKKKQPGALNSLRSIILTFTLKVLRVMRGHMVSMQLSSMITI